MSYPWTGSTNKVGAGGYKQQFGGGKRKRAKQLAEARERKKAMKEPIAVPHPGDHDALVHLPAATSILRKLRSDYNSLKNSYNEVITSLKTEETNQLLLKEQILLLQQCHLEDAKKIKETESIIIEMVCSREVDDSIMGQLKGQLELKDFEIAKLQNEIEIQKNAFSARIVQLENENILLKAEVASLKAGLQEALAHGREAEDNSTRLKDSLKKNNEINETLLKARDHYLEITKKEGGVVFVRGAGTKTKGSPLVEVSLGDTEATRVKVKTLKKRADQLHQFLALLSSKSGCGTSARDEDLVKVLAQMLKRHPTLAVNAYQEAELSSLEQLSVEDSLDLKLLLNISFYKFRHLRNFFDNHGMKVFASEAMMRQEQSKRFLSCENLLEVGTAKLKKEKSSTGELEDVPFVRCTSIHGPIQDFFTRNSGDTICMPDEFQGEVWLKFGGDKGGTTTKLCFQIANIVGGNSAENTQLLAFYEATDSDDNLRDMFSMYSTQFSQLETIENADGISLKVRKFVFGDYKFLSSVFGHMGQASKYPCMFCLVELDDLRRCDGSPHTPLYVDETGRVVELKFTPRTLEQIMEDYGKVCDAPGDRKANAKKNHSILYDVLFPTELDQVAPLPLHLYLGIVQDLYKMMEGVADQCDANNNAVDQTLWQDMTDSAAAQSDKVACLKDQVEKEKLIVQAWDEMDGARRARRNEEDPCAAVRCIINTRAANSIVGPDEPIGWIFCVKCKEWFHHMCLGITISSQVPGDNEDYACPACNELAGEIDMPRYFETMLDISQQELQEAMELEDALQVQLQHQYEVVKSGMGKVRRQLEANLKSLGIDKQAYHSQAFVGNHIQKMLKIGENIDNPMFLLGAFEDHQDTLSKFYDVMALLSRLHPLLFEARFLSPEEIKSLTEMCHELGYIYPKSFPSRTITPKLHTLIFHVPEFARRWKTVGLFSEAGLESIHRVVNAKHRMYCTIRCRTRQMSLVFREHTLQSTSAPSQITPAKPRNCISTSGCTGKYAIAADPTKTTPLCRVCKLPRPGV